MQTALGGQFRFRIIDYISHSNVWSSSAIFIEEDDAQRGVDHVDGHRSPGYSVSPCAVQNVYASNAKSHLLTFTPSNTTEH